MKPSLEALHLELQLERINRAITELEQSYNEALSAFTTGCQGNTPIDECSNRQDGAMKSYNHSERNSVRSEGERRINLLRIFYEVQMLERPTREKLNIPLRPPDDNSQRLPDRQSRK